MLLASGHQSLASLAGGTSTGYLRAGAGVVGIQCRVHCAAGIVCNVITSSRSVRLLLQYEMKTFM